LSAPDPLSASATELARAIRAGELRSRQVVDAHLSMIERWNPSLNAVVAARFDHARQEADAADQAVAAGAPLGALHGVPCTIKECFQVAGMPHTAGLVARVGREVAEDAPTVARLRAAGAIVMGVTNTSELCMWMESSNRVYGRTNNPYDTSRTVGGSSGGEGAAVGCGATPFGLGSDIGGSIRMPAFFNGVFGHKPSPGLIPNTGQFPDAHGEAQRYLGTGPLCRRAEDLAPLVRILAGRDDAIGDVDATPVRKVIVVRGRGTMAISDEMVAAQDAAAECLAASGAQVGEVELPALRESLEIWAAMLGVAQGKSSFRRDMMRPGSIDLWIQALLWLVGRSPHTLPAIGLGLIENLGNLMPGRQRALIDAGRQLKQDVEALIGDGVMLYPSYPTTAPRHFAPLFPPINYATTSIFNVLQVPVTQVPLGLDRRGLPLGVQVVGVQGADTTTLAAARTLERGLGGWVPPTFPPGQGA
jgi:fatty acid amide hydrolase 2